jgi:signal peptidase I
VGVWVGATAGRHTDPRKRFIRVFGLAGLIWFACLWLQIGMTLLPRYYMMPSAVLAMLVGIWLATVAVPRSALLAGLILVGVVATNLMGIYIDNRNPVYGERSVISFLEQNPDVDVVVTDPETARRGRFLYIANGVEDRVTGAVPQPGDVYVYNPRYVTLGFMQGGTPESRQARLDELSVYRPSPEWQEVWRADPGHRWIGVLIESLGLKPLVPAEIFRRLDQPNLPVVAYRIPTPVGRGRPNP